MDKEFKDINSPEANYITPGASYWNQRWEKQEIGWDIGYASPTIKAYTDQYPAKDAAILIPGCGNAYEAEYLVEKGFSNITLIDIAPKAVEMLKEKFRHTVQVRILCENFFEHEGIYDLMIEQTFFCALDPGLRQQYVSKAASLLRTDARIVGLLFNIDFEKKGPPFGGSKEAYQALFEKLFDIKTLAACYNSIPSRNGAEVFINFKKRQDEYNNT